jgi:hypothetical protein
LLFCATIKKEVILWDFLTCLEKIENLRKQIFQQIILKAAQLKHCGTVELNESGRQH